jgi:hypothetical protein
MRSIGNYLEPAKSINLYGEYDVIVVGGGCSGFPAAIAAARNGAKVLSIERFPFFGGTATAALMSNIVGFRNQVEPEYLQTSKGIAEELILRLLAENGAVKSRNAYPSKQHSDTKGDLSYNYAVDTEKFKFVVLQMVKEAGVDILFHTFFSDVIRGENRSLQGVIVENKSGRHAVFAKIIVDATGDGDVAFKAGVPYWQTKKEEAPRLYDCLMYKVAGFPLETKAPGSLFVDQMVVWGPKCGGADATDADDLTREEIETRLSVYHDLAEKMKIWPEDLREARVVQTPSHLGIRQTRFFYGEYILAGDDVLEGRRFEDSIAMAVNPVIEYYGYRRFLTHAGYQIPYRAIIPQNASNLYVVGRCMSSDQVAFESWRAMAPIMSIGEAAGVAAAVCVQDGVLPRDIDVKKLQKTLIEQGCEIGQGIIEKMP